MTGAILAGGENTRFPSIKGLIKIDGERIIDRNLKMLKNYFNEVLISTNDPVIYFYTKAPLIGDIINQRGPLTGILSSLINSKYNESFFMACDMPFIKKEVIELIKTYSSGYDAVVPIYNSEAQPLLAVYNKSIIPVVEKLIRENKKSIKNMLKYINVKFINEEKVRSVDEDGQSFININTIEDLKSIEADVLIYNTELKYYKQL